MKRLPFILLMLSFAVLSPTLVQAEKFSSIAVENAVMNGSFDSSALIKFARQGDIEKLLGAAEHKTDGEFLKAQDHYKNNLFHVAKNADTVQAIAALIRRFYGAKASAQIKAMVNQRNSLDETPLLAQINAGHADTFRPLYAYSVLKEKNELARNQLARLQGSGTAIEGRNKAIYCKEIRSLASANRLTLLQAAQGQVPYHPEMAPLARALPHMIPCLAQN